MLFEKALSSYSRVLIGRPPNRKKGRRDVTEKVGGNHRIKYVRNFWN